MKVADIMHTNLHTLDVEATVATPLRPSPIAVCPPCRWSIARAEPWAASEALSRQTGTASNAHSARRSRRTATVPIAPAFP